MDYMDYMDYMARSLDDSVRASSYADQGALVLKGEACVAGRAGRVSTAAR